MARTKMKTRSSNLPVPQSDAEAREAIRELGDCNRAIVRLQSEMNDKIAAIQEEYGAKSEPLSERATALTEGIRNFCEANRDRLTNGGKVKFHRFSTGEISWRLLPAKVTVRGKDEVIEQLKAAGLAKFIRTKADINKEAMLATKEDRALAGGFKGITIGSDGEDFAVEPFETELKEG